MTGKTILHYKIIEELGRGGMGVVYKARDSKLDRNVAIKFLPLQVAANAEERHRFEIEAKAAAALNHPNIATIYAIEEADEQMFIVMEYIEGKELREIIQSAIPDPQSAIEIATQIASGLQAAHAKGIVHRDIKSSNIMVADDGKIKIMDFGLAKMKGGPHMTRAGSTLGTPYYMSPEQARGEEVDARTDIWAFGVVLYEMLTGELPFKGEYEQAVIYAILNEAFTPIAQLQPEVTGNVQQVVEKALAKDPNLRYQNMDELLGDLKSEANIGNRTPEASRRHRRSESAGQPNKRLVLAAILTIVTIIAAAIGFWNRFSGPKSDVSGQIKRIAVLPLKNLGPAEQDYFADGLTGEITSKLSGLSGLAVIAHSSAMQYKNSTKSLQQIGKELGVDYVLSGTLQWEENNQGERRVRVNPELIRLSDKTQVWSQPYEADFSSAFKLQAKVASTVAQALNVNLVGRERDALQEELTQNSEAYDLYLRALQFSTSIADEKGQRVAGQLLQQAIGLDDRFAAAYAELSTIQSNMHWSYHERSRENLNRSKANASKALELAPELPQAHEAMGNYLYHGELKYEDAIKEYEKAIQLQPSYAYGYAGMAWVRRRQGLMREAIVLLKKAYTFDPKNFNVVFSLGETHYLLREYQQARPYLVLAITLLPDGVQPLRTYAWNFLLESGSPDKARMIVNDAIKRKIGEKNPDFLYTLYWCDLIDRDYTSALSRLDIFTELNTQFSYAPQALLKAYIYALMGEKVSARSFYDKAHQQLLKHISKSPDDSRAFSSLGLAYAGLGMKEEAIREGKRGIELLPMSKEAWRGSYRVLDLAKIYTMVGEPELALDLLDDLLGKPTDAISVALLKVDPTWEPLRGNPQYQQLLKKYSTGETE